MTRHHKHALVLAALLIEMARLAFRQTPGRLISGPQTVGIADLSEPPEHST